MITELFPQNEPTNRNVSVNDPGLALVVGSAAGSRSVIEARLVYMSVSGVDADGNRADGLMIRTLQQTLLPLLRSNIFE